MEKAEPAKPGRYPFAAVKAAKNCWKRSCQGVRVLPGSRKGDDCPGCRDPGRAKVWVWQACSALSTSSQGALVLGGKAGHPIGSVPRLLSRLQWEGVWVSPCVFLFPVVNTFLWVKHLLPLYTFGIVGIIRHVLFYCFFLSLKYYLNS